MFYHVLKRANARRPFFDQPGECEAFGTGDPARQSIGQSQRHAAFLEDFGTPCQFFWLARWGRWVEIHLTSSLSWQRANWLPWHEGDGSAVAI